MGVPAGEPGRLPLCFYYGAGQLAALSRYRRVVLQPEFYPSSELGYLVERGVQPLAYLSLTEDQGPPAAWQRPERNSDWGGAYVHVGHPGWTSRVLGQAGAALAGGFQGLFLDTLNVELTFPEDLPRLLALVAAIREQAGTRYLLANRGFGLLPRLAELVDGIVFESFSARWTQTGYASWPPNVLEVHGQIADDLQAFDVDRYALDYADSPGLAEFAMRRAREFGLECVVSDRTLSQV